jgi:hypothetical protein
MIKIQVNLIDVLNAAPRDKFIVINALGKNEVKN